MGLFSKKKHAQTIQEAIDYGDDDFSYVTRKGRRQRFFPAHASAMQENLGAWDLDDAFEMYAPNLLATIEETNKNMKVLLEQNLLLQEKVLSLEKKISNLEHNHTPTIKR